MALDKATKENLITSLSIYAFPDYTEYREMRTIVDDCLNGQKTIKEKRKYLPPNKWQEAHTEEYNAFLRRALFPGETNAALKTYHGLFLLGTPNVVLPKDGKMDYLIHDCSVYHDGLKSVQVRSNVEQMKSGFRCMFLEVRENTEKSFFITEVEADRFLDVKFTKIDGEEVPEFILLNDSRMEYNLKTFKREPSLQLKVLALDKNKEYYVRTLPPRELHQLDVKNPPMDGKTVYPALYKTKRYNRIPFVWCNATSLSGKTLDAPQMLEMAYTELKLYMSMAYSSQHIYMNTQEFLFFKGVPADFRMEDVELGAGAGVAMRSPDADCKYVSTNGVGFAAEKEEIAFLKSDLENKKMSLMSAKSHQSGSVVGMVQNAQSGPLRVVVTTSGLALTNLLQHAANWMGYDKKEVERVQYTPSQRFADAKVNLSEYIALCRAVMEDGAVLMLEEDLYTLGKESGWINSDFSWDAFLKKYKIQKRIRESQTIPNKKGNPFVEKE